MLRGVEALPVAMVIKVQMGIKNDYYRCNTPEIQNSP